MKLLIIDNYDSFTYNIAHAVKSLGVAPDVKRNDMIKVEDAGNYDKIIISPGPGIPSEAGIVPQVLKAYGTRLPILGICLGHQAIGESFGAKLINLPEVYHGVKTRINIIAEDYLFDGLGKSFDVGRYHSWSISPDGFPESLQVTAVDSKGDIMAIRHRALDIRGVQFHPESIMTECGTEIFRNWLNH